MDLFIAKKVLTALVLPPTGPLLVALVGLALLSRRPRWGRALAWLGVLSLFALSLPLVSHTLLRAVDQSPPLDFARTQAAQAVASGEEPEQTGEDHEGAEPPELESVSVYMGLLRELVSYYSRSESLIGTYQAGAKQTE